MVPGDVELAPGDLSDAVGLVPHLYGVGAVFLLRPFPTVESVRKLGPELIDPLAADVGRVVYLSATPAADLHRFTGSQTPTFGHRGVSFIGLREQTDDHERHGGRKNSSD